AISAAAGAGQWMEFVVACIQLLVLALVPIALVYTLGKLGLKLAGGAWHATERRPAARAGLLVAAATVAAFAAYAWLPSSMYRPIGPTEKGTLGDAGGRREALPRGHAGGEPGRSPSAVGAPPGSG